MMKEAAKIAVRQSIDAFCVGVLVATIVAVVITWALR
jgi:hypothetical protein